jgi:hypothetical protein
MKKILVFFVLFFSGSWLLIADSQNKTFTSKELGFSFTYPARWEISTSKYNPLISLYSPETKKHPHKTLDLEKGIKMELVILPEEDFKRTMSHCCKKFAILTDEKDSITIYSEEDKNDFLILHALIIKRDNKGLWVAGYIPEKDKRAIYVEQYLLILQSIKIESDFK